MTNALETLPNPTDFGKTFNYAAWTPNTQIRLCNVPWNNDYRDVVRFDNDAALDTYLNSVSGPAFTITKMTYARMGDPIRVNLPFNVVNRFNYIRVSNPTEPITASYTDGNGVEQTLNDFTKTLYYFVLEVRYIAPNTTEIIIQLDVWQTFRRSCDLGSAFVERGHLGIANENAFQNQGRDFLTVPEGLDLGNDYRITKVYDELITSVTDKHPWVMVGTSVNFEDDPGTVDNPYISPATGDQVDGIANGLDIWFFKDIGAFYSTMAAFAETPWVLQGIQFIQVLPDLDDAIFSGVSGQLSEHTINLPGSATAIAYKSTGLSIPPKIIDLAPNWREDALSSIPLRYRHLKKFLTFPYCLVEMTTYNGQPLVVKPEILWGDDMEVSLYRHISPPTPRWTVIPRNYNNDTGFVGDASGEFFDMATHITNFPQLNILNDNFINYMASNRNRIAYDFQSADWSQQRALMGNNAAFSNAGTGIAATRASTAASVGAMEESAVLSVQMGVLNGLTNTAQGAMAGGLPGAVAGGVGGTIGAGTNFYQQAEQLNINRNLANAQRDVSVNAASQVRDTNKTYADAAAQGDYSNAIAGINARVQDAKMLQPSVIGQMGGESFMMSTGLGLKIFAKIKMPNLAAITTVGDFWLRYGYAINRFFYFSEGGVESGEMTMTKFTYWKMKEVSFRSALCPESFKQTLRGIYEKGVTIWSDPSYIGTIDIADNDPLPGISYSL